MRLSLPNARLFLVALAALSVPAVVAAPALSGRDPASLYRPFQAERASLSRDGQKVAYTVYEGRQLAVVVQTLAPEPSRQTLDIDDLPYAGVDALDWITPDRLVVATRTPALYVLDLSRKSVRRILDATLFEPWSADQPVPRPPRYLGPVPGQPNAVWVEGRSQVDADAEDPFSPLANPFSESSPGEAAGDDAPPERPRAGFGGGGRGPARVHVTERVKLDLDRGTWDSWAYVSGYDENHVIYDHDGHARIKRTGPGTRQTYFYQPADTGLSERWEPFERWLGTSRPPRFRLSADSVLGERAIPLGFDPDPDLLYFASNVGQDTYGLQVLNLKTREARPVLAAPAGRDLIDFDPTRPVDPLVFDRATRRLVGIRHSDRESLTVWTDPVIIEAAKAATAAFPRRTARLIDWDDVRGRFLVRAEAPHEPGRLFVYHRDTGRWVEVMRFAPWIERTENHASRAFDRPSSGGDRLVGRITLPRATLTDPPPLVLWLNDLPGSPSPETFHRDAQAVADLGAVFVQLDYPGTGGLGQRHRLPVPQQPLDRRVAEACEQTLDWLATEVNFDPRRVIIVGEGLGGYFALRNLRLLPGRFRGAVCINAPLHPDHLGQMSAARRQAEQRRYRDALARYQEERESWGGVGPAPRRPQQAAETTDWIREARAWLFARGPRLPAVADEADLAGRPVLFLQDPAHPALPIEPVQSLIKSIKTKPSPVELKPIPPHAGQADLPGRIPVIVLLRDFLNEVVYRTRVDVGETKERRGP